MIKVKRPVLIAAGLLLLTALLVGEKFPYMFLYLTALIVLVPALTLRGSLRRLKGSVEVGSYYGEVGQLIKIRYRITNSRTAKFPYLELVGIIGVLSGNREEENRVIALRPGETAVLERDVRCIRRGKYNLDALKVRTGDPFGFVKLERSLAHGEEIKVYPSLRRISTIPLPARQFFGELSVKERFFENYSHITDLREYRDGDSTKRIHWKQSAKHDRVIVKNFAQEGDASLNIFLDMNREAYREDAFHLLEDLSVEIAASFVYLALAGSVPLKIFCETEPGSPLAGNSFRDYRDIMDKLIGLAPVGDSPFSSYIDAQCYYLTPNSSLYLITPYIGLKEAATILGVKQRGFFVVLFYLCLSKLSPGGHKLLQKMKEAGVPVYIMEAGNIGSGERISL